MLMSYRPVKSLWSFMPWLKIRILRMGNPKCTLPFALRDSLVLRLKARYRGWWGVK